MNKTSLTLDNVDIWFGVTDIRPKAIIRVVDLETAGLDPDDQVVEIGAVDLNVYTGDVCDVASRIIRPSKSIPPQASAIHHLTDADVANAPSWSDVWPQVFTADQNIIAFAAHNASFDSRWISGDLPTHRALPDAFVTAHLLRQILNRASVDDLIDWSKQPALLNKVTFGKHKGLKWTDVPDDYLDWIISKRDFNEDVMHTVQTIRASRRASAASAA
jgi:exodeoxyribonuclease X